MIPNLEEAILAELGEDGLERVVHAFYERVASDPLLRPMYPEGDLAPAERRLADFLIFRFGGSKRYLEERGHPRLRARHAEFPIDVAAREAWMRNMDSALSVTVENVDLRHSISNFLGQVASFLINRQA